MDERVNYEGGEWVVDAGEIMDGAVETELEAAPEAAGPEEGESFELKHLGEAFSVDRERVTELAQKGLDYDRIREKLDAELAQLLMDIERYHSILSSHVVLDSVVKSELQEVKAAYSDKRRTDIENDVEEVAAEDLIPEEEIVVALTRDGYIRRMPLQDYRVQQAARASRASRRRPRTKYR